MCYQATGLMFGLALLSALSLAYEAALWRAVAAEAATAGAAGVPSSAPLPYGSTGTRYVGAGGSSGGRRRLNVLYASGMAGLLGPSGLLRRAVEYVTYVSGWDMVTWDTSLGLERIDTGLWNDF